MSHVSCLRRTAFSLATATAIAAAIGPAHAQTLDVPQVSPAVDSAYAKLEASPLYRKLMADVRADDARALAEVTGIGTETVEITAQIDAYFEAYPEAGRLRRGNKMARERMTILYDHSAEREALVLGTSNKTELLLGYGTLHGDMASAINPLGDLYKTQVWGLARHLELPEAIVDKAPSADLWSGQTDEEELGFGYDEVDRLLYRMVDERTAADELIEAGFDQEFVRRIGQMVQGSQFKRRLPVIAKLSTRTIDMDFRYARDWGR